MSISGRVHEPKKHQQSKYYILKTIFYSLPKLNNFFVVFAPEFALNCTLTSFLFTNGGTHSKITQPF